MHTHVRVLGTLFIAVSSLFLLAALFLGVALGGAAGIVGAAADPEDAAVAIPILGIAGTWLIALLLLLALPGLVTGWGLLKFRVWARILGIVLCALELVAFPLGTLVGIYGLWVLLSRETEPLFTDPPANLPVSL